MTHFFTFHDFRLLFRFFIAAALSFWTAVDSPQNAEFLFSTAHAEYLSSEQAGFRNCALIYYNPEYQTEAFKPFLVKYVNGKPTSQQGFDAFLFLYYSLNGKKLEVAATTRSEWLEFFDGWFTRQVNGQAINVPALNQAAEDLKRQNYLPNQSDYRIPVIFSISWLNPAVTDFGDVNQDGKSEDLSTIEGRRAVLDWYMTEIANRMKAFPNLRLWGFYMMREGLEHEAQQAIGREYCRAIHEKGYRALWIPYYNAGGVEQGTSIGFDAVIMQSNWTFRAKPDGSGARRNQLVKAADFAQKNGLGIELEINPPAQQPWRAIFKKTLETGAETGFQNAASAAYFGSRFFWPDSDDPEDRDLYALWMDYLAGKPVRLPSIGTWKPIKNQNSGKNDKKYDDYIYKLKEPAVVTLLDVFLSESPEQFFSGSVEVFGRIASQAKQTQPNQTEPNVFSSDESVTPGSTERVWRPLGWTYRSSYNNSLESFQNISLQLIPQSSDELLIRFTPCDACSTVSICSIEPDIWTPPLAVSLAYRKPYQCSKRQSEPDYPDSTGCELVDGTTSGSWSKYVGWSGNDRVTIAFDLNSVQTFDTIRTHFLLEPSAGIQLPSAQSALYSLNPGRLSQSGYGALPAGYASSGKFAFISETNSSTALPDSAKQKAAGDDKFRMAELKCETPVQARGLTLTFDHSGWLFLSEVELYYQGRKLDSSEFQYTISPQVGGNRTKVDQYGDDGRCLTDGIVCSDYNKDSVGVIGSENLTAIVDLGSVESIRRVTCFVIDGGSAGVVLPQSVAVRVSQDGKNWSPSYPVSLPKPEKKATNFSVEASLDLPPTEARFVEVVVRPRGWAFLSEIMVE